MVLNNVGIRERGRELLPKIEIAVVTELVITAIDVGFLTPPRNQFKFRSDETAQRKYFETASISRLVVAVDAAVVVADIKCCRCLIHHLRFR